MYHIVHISHGIFSCDQAALRTLISVCLSVRPSVRLKTNCCVGRSTVLLEIDCIIGRSIAMLEDEWKMKGIIRKSAVLKTINWIRWKLPIKENNARRWLHKYVGAECGASSFTWYLYQMCNTDVHLWHLFDNVPVIISSWNFELLPLTDMMSMQKVKVRGQMSRSHLAVSRP